MKKVQTNTGIVRAGIALMCLLALGCLHVRGDENDPQKIKLIGTLHRAMAIGAESTGWIVQVDSQAIIDGKPISSIEVNYEKKPDELEKFDNKRVRIAGKVAYRHGVERGVQSYIEINSIKPAKPGEDKP
jgi:hypothetical protein